MRMDFFSSLVEKEIEGAKATVTAEGSKFEAIVVSNAFDGVSPVNRHKMVYSVLEEHIKSGAIHALTIKAHTEAEFAAKQGE